MENLTTHVFHMQLSKQLTYGAFVWLFSRVDSHMNEQLVPGIERLASSDAVLPQAREIIRFPFLYVRIFNMLY